MNVHLDMLYLLESGTSSQACGNFFMGWFPTNGDPIKLNGAFFTLCTILHVVVASTVEAELGAFYLYCKEGMIFHLTLEDLGHLKPKSPIYCNNATTVGIANNTVKWKRLLSMEMRYFWICDKVAQDAYNIKWHPGQENLANY
jgi:hypothetical protein